MAANSISFFRTGSVGNIPSGLSGYPILFSNKRSEMETRKISEKTPHKTLIYPKNVSWLVIRGREGMKWKNYIPQEGCKDTWVSSSVFKSCKIWRTLHNHVSPTLCFSCGPVINLAPYFSCLPAFKYNISMCSDQAFEKVLGQPATGNPAVCFSCCVFVWNSTTFSFLSKAKVFSWPLLSL